MSSSSVYEGAVQTTGREMNSERRDEPRGQIMRAARTLAEREGVENLTLGKVASEANLPRPVVFGQFVRKEDLLLCVAADSVATLAREISHVYLSSATNGGDESNAGAVILSLPRPEAINETTGKMVGLAREISAALGAPADSSADSTAVDPALDRRLRDFELALETILSRQDEIEKKTHAVVANVEDSITQAVSKLSELVTRVDKSETQQKATANDLRATLNDAKLRIETVEGVARAALVENGSAHAGNKVQAPAPESEKPANEKKEDAPAEAEVPVHTPLAHLGAKAATTGSIAEPFKPKIVAAPEPGKPSYRLRYAAAALVVVSIFVAAAGVAFLQGVRDGHRAALQNDVLVLPSRAVSAARAMTSLDRLAARAERGDSASELAVAIKYLNDAKPTGDPVAGFRWMSRAALHGNAVAQYLLGTLFQQGVGTPANPREAARWYQSAAMQGNRKAMHNLGIAYAEGLGVAKNPSEAVRWLSRAANFGYLDSQFDLAVLYERGQGVPLSLLDAYKWYAIAGSQGDSESKVRVDALRSQLSSDDLAAAQRAADAFRPLPFSAAANLPPKI